MWKQSAAKRRKAAAMVNFDYMRANTMEKESPLAARMRPTTLDEVVGQKHIIGKDKLLYRAIKADKLGSVIFTARRNGKDDSGEGDREYDKRPVRADQCYGSREKDMEEIVKNAKDAIGMYGKKTILFVDEIHRFN